MRAFRCAPSADPELARTLLGIHARPIRLSDWIDDDRIPALHGES